MSRFDNFIDDGVIEKTYTFCKCSKYVYKSETRPSSSFVGSSTIFTNQMLMEKLCALTDKVNSIRSKVDSLISKVDTLQNFVTTNYDFMNHKIEGLSYQLELMQFKSKEED